MNYLNKISKRIIAFFILLLIVILAGCEGDKTYYQVTFVYNNDVTSDLVVSVEANTYTSMPSQPEKDRYEFVGWYLNGELFDFGSVVTSDITLEARYEIDEDLAETYVVTFEANGETIRKANVKEGRTVGECSAPAKEGGTFLYWTLNGEEYDFTNQIYSNMTLVAKYEVKKFTITFIANGEKTTQSVEYGNKAIKPTDPIKTNKQFDGWYSEGELFDFDTVIKKDYTLNAKFVKLPGDVIHITYDFGYDCFQTKDDLRIAYYTDFYNFLVSKEYDFSKWEITDLDSFLKFLNTWTYKGRSEMGNIGNAFGSYYLTIEVGGRLEDQPDTTFIGWCYKNGKYVDFINHLMVFFAYWRTDEGYSQSDPNGNDFFASNWASMVDTAKFFYFTSDNLNDTYAWFTSERVKYALDHIPGVGYVTLVTEEKEADSVTLPQDVTRDGYEFTGWVDENGEKVEVVYDSIKVTATWKKVENNN